MEVLDILRPNISLRVINDNFRNSHLISSGRRIRKGCVIEIVLLEIVIDGISLVHVQKHLWEQDRGVKRCVIQLHVLFVGVAIGVIAALDPDNQHRGVVGITPVNS
jgi:hypothetical protein